VCNLFGLHQGELLFSFTLRFAVNRIPYYSEAIYYSTAEQPSSQTCGAGFTACFSRSKGAFGVRQLAAAFSRILEKQAHSAIFKSGSEQPHISEGALWAQ
jgi:hypothetical protein